MYRAEGATVVYVHDDDMTEELFLTVHPTRGNFAPEQQAASLARLFNDMDTAVKIRSSA